MNNKLKIANRVLVIAAAVAVAIFLVLYVLRKVYNFDIWWHLATARWMLENGLIENDPFSYTAAGAPLVNPYWIAQILLLKLWAGAVIFKTAVIFTAFSLSFLTAIRGRREAAFIAVPILFIAIFASSERFVLRPEIFTLLFGMLFFYILTLYQQKQTRWIYILPVLHLLWVNMHPGWVFGVALIVLFILVSIAGRFFRGTTREKNFYRRLLIVGGLCIVVSFMNPYGLSYVLYPFRLLFGYSYAKESVLEWGSSLSGLANLFSLKFVYFKILIGLLVGSVLLNWRRFDPTRTAVAFALLLLVFFSYRHIALFALLSVPVVVENLYQPLCRRPRRFLLPVTAGVSIVVIVLCGYYCRQVVTNRYYAKRELFNLSFGTGVSGSSYPSVACHWLEEQIRAGAVSAPVLFHNYETGGFIMYHLYPEVRVFIDGRLLHYQEKLYKKYRNLETAPATFDALAEEQNIDTVVILHSLPRLTGLMRRLARNRVWELRYADSLGCIFTRVENAELALVKKAPRKVNPALLSLKAYEQFDYPYFHIISFAHFLLLIDRSDAAVEMLSAAVKEYQDKPKLKLLLGQAYLNTERFEDAAGWLKQALKLLPENTDALLGLARAQIGLRNYQQAQRYLKRLFKLDPHNRRYKALLERIRR